jgi:hypothetical protein
VVVTRVLPPEIRSHWCTGSISVVGLEAVGVCEASRAPGRAYEVAQVSRIYTLEYAD